MLMPPLHNPEITLIIPGHYGIVLVYLHTVEGEMKLDLKCQALSGVILSRPKVDRDKYL